MTLTRRCLAAGLLWFGFAVWGAMPASAQADLRYTGSGAALPTINSFGGPAGGALAASGQREAAAVSESVPSQVVTSQVSGVFETAQAPMQGLAFTGADIVTLSTIGLVALSLGIILNRRARPSSLAKQ